LPEPTGPVGPVYWGSYPGDLLEGVMSVLLFQERPTAWRRRPSQGHDGLDVGEPKPGGYHVYQIKGFTGSMTSSRRGQVRRSLQRVLDDPRLDRPVTLVPGRAAGSDLRGRGVVPTGHRSGAVPL
jgi:hypothetical protein